MKVDVPKNESFSFAEKLWWFWGESLVIQQALFLKVTILTPRFILSTILAWITQYTMSTYSETDELK